MHPADNSFTAPHYTIVGLLAFLIVLMLIMMAIVVCYFKRRVAGKSIAIDCFFLFCFVRPPQVLSIDIIDSILE